ncbi:Na+/H+ antiporter subunit A [Paenibacillus cisolokensis]|uniref:Na+/H+ antiporter subunit A n=1 Tax=Paenibacillus cisolokensis TaxID=1658519 RepID=UPI003D26A969
MSTLHFAVMAPFIAALVVLLIYKITRRIHTGWLILPVPVLLFVYFLGLIPSIQAGNPVHEVLEWIPSLGINFTVYLDGLSLIFTLLISGIGSLVVLYSIFYMDKNKEAVHRFYIYLLLFMGAMLGVVLSDNLMVLYGFWEMTSISSFLLIAFWNHRDRSRYGALKSMLITVFGGLAMLAGFILLYVMAGTFSVREIISNLHTITDHALFIPAMILVLLGAFTKSAQFPFHIWLPDAMEAPTPVSAYLHSATMVKAGIYLVARLSPVFAGHSLWIWLVSATGLVTLIYASVRAIKQTDLKALLAFSTISQLGLIMSLLGLGSAAAYFSGSVDTLIYTKATTAAVFHLMNHAIFKGALFMVVGIVDHETGTRDIRRLGGLMTLMPITFTVAVIGAFSMAGLPPFNGFLSKEMFFTAVLHAASMEFWNVETWGVLIPIVAWIASVFTFVYSMILVFRTFTGRLQSDKLEKQPHEAPIGMLTPPVILASLAIVFGLFPNLLSYSLIEPAMASIHPSLLQPGGFNVKIEFWHGWTPEIFMTIAIIIVGTLLYFLHGKLAVLNTALTRKLSLNHLYDWGLRSLEGGGRSVTKSYMTGSLRHYVLYIFVFFIAVLGGSLLLTDHIRFDISEFAPMSIYEAAAVIGLVVPAIVLPFVRTRLMAIILTGAIGYMVVLFFVLFRAPDLALTQMIVETVSVMLFLLCFYHLPKLKREKVAMSLKWKNLLISAGAGAVVTLIALAASSDRAFESISEFFVKESYTLAGGKNIVNVILVDFRGFDTMLEVMVLGIAALGIFALIKVDSGEGVLGKREAASDLHLPNSNDVILRTISRVVIFIVLAFSWYLFMAGHNEPGGGFIGGLMTTAALVLLSMAYGMDMTKNIIPVSFRRMTAIGLMIALLTGVGSFLFGAPFLSHAFDYFDLPLLGETELATAVLFDLGVYLAVVGVTMTIINSIGRDN